jgi:hypothetical protein
VRMVRLCRGFVVADFATLRALLIPTRRRKKARLFAGPSKWNHLALDDDNGSHFVVADACD